MKEDYNKKINCSDGSDWAAGELQERIDDAIKKNKKYILLDNGLTIFGDNGKCVSLYQIMAVKDVNSVVHKGDLGGFIESEHNLSHEGECWVDIEVIVYDNATVTCDAWVSGESRIYGSATIRGRVTIYGRCEICDHVTVNGRAMISGDDIRCSGNAMIFDDVVIRGDNIVIRDNAFIIENGVVLEHTIISNDMSVRKPVINIKGYKMNITLTDNCMRIGGTVYRYEEWFMLINSAGFAGFLKFQHAVEFWDLVKDILEPYIIKRLVLLMGKDYVLDLIDSMSSYQLLTTSELNRFVDYCEGA